MKMDQHGSWIWMKMDEDGRTWMKMDEDGRTWMKMDEDG